MKILIVEDEPAIARLVGNSLQRSGHLVDTVDDGLEAIQRIDVYDYDVMILDIMLPGADGYEICQHIRSLGLNSKIIMLSARDDIDSKIKCLNIGADDYMTKPFSFAELEARVRALSRREKLVRTKNLEAGGLALDIEKRTAAVNDKPLKTSLIEFRLLEYLIRNKSKICTRTMLKENIWGQKERLSNVMNATMSKLRAKIKKLNNNKDIIKTVPKSGYIIC